MLEQKQTKKNKLLYYLQNKWLSILALCITVFMLCMMYFPIYWLIVSSTKDTMEARKTPPNFWFVPHKYYTVCLDTTGIEGYTADDFQYEALVLGWMISDRGLNLNLNGVSVARVENNRVIARAELSYEAYQVNKLDELFYGKVNQAKIDNWRDKGNEKYDRLISIMESEGYETGLNESAVLTFDRSDTYIDTLTNYLMLVTDPEEANISDYERINIKGKIVGVTYRKVWSALLNNIKTAWEFSNGMGHTFFRYILNSIILALGFIFLHLLFDSIAGYSMQFLLKKETVTRVVTYCLMTVPIPAIVTQIPMYLLITRLGLLDTYFGVWFSGWCSFVNALLFKAYFSSLSGELRDAAKIDGARELAIMLKIYVPLAAPCYGAIAMMTFTGSWGSFFWENLILQSTEIMPLTLIIQSVISSGGGAERNYTLSLAMGLIACVPTLFIYGFMQKSLQDGLMLGSLKG